MAKEGRNHPPHLLAAQKGNAKTTTTMTTLYHPSIFRYSCTGKLSLDSKHGGRSKASAGVCHGIQSKLEHIDHWRLSTREEAIKQFEYKSSMEYSNPEDDYYNSTAANEEGPSAHAEQAVYLSNVLLYPNDESSSTAEQDDDNNNTPKTNKIKETMVSRKNTDGSTTITPQQETWSCYGSTEVDLLVLRPQNGKDETIAGVASYCAPGMTIRDMAIAPTSIGVGSETGGKERTTTVRLGILEIVYATVLEGHDETNDVDLPDATSAPNGGGLWQGPPVQVWNSGTKILKHMSINGNLLYESLQDDYPGRTLEASKRITNEFQKTWDRTTGLMKKVGSFVLFGEDWDDDDDDADR